MHMASVHFGMRAVAFGLTIYIDISSIKHTGLATHPKEKVLKEDDVIAFDCFGNHHAVGRLQCGGDPTCNPGDNHRSPSSARNCLQG